MPYCFPRSSIKFHGHTGQNITDFDPNWAFPDDRPVAAFKSLRFALFLLVSWFCICRALYGVLIYSIVCQYSIFGVPYRWNCVLLDKNKSRQRSITYRGVELHCKIPRIYIYIYIYSERYVFEILMVMFEESIETTGQQKNITPSDVRIHILLARSIRCQAKPPR